MRHLLDIMDLSVAEIDELIATANDIIARPAAYADACAGKKLATLFFEPSTRTRLSFEAAMLDLGGKVLGFSDAQCSSSSRARAWRTLSMWSAATPISSPCATPKRAPPEWPPCTARSRLSTPGTADTTIPPRPSRTC